MRARSDLPSIVPVTVFPRPSTPSPRLGKHFSYLDRKNRVDFANNNCEEALRTHAIEIR